MSLGSQSPAQFKERQKPTFHVFQIAKPNVGSTLLNCILQGLLDKPASEYSFIPAVPPSNGGKHGPWPPGVTQKYVDELARDGKVNPFLFHNGRLKLAQENLWVTAVTKTHIVDVN